MQPLRAQRRALQHAEAMLLVDDRESELAERDVFLDERVRADRHVHRSTRELGEQLAALLRGRRAGEQRDPEPCLLEQPPDVEVVLLGEDFRRRHEGHLQAVLHRDERRHQGDDRLPGPDVPLQQAVHRLRPLHVGDDLPDDRLLISGQLERQHLAYRLACLIRDDDRARLALAVGAAAPQDDAELEEEELLEDQPPVRRRAEPIQVVDRRACRGEVHLLERVAALDQVLADAHRGRQRIGQLRRHRLQRLVHERALHLRRELARLLVHRHDPPGVDRAAVERVTIAFAPFVRSFDPIPLFDAFHQFVLRTLHLEPVRGELELAEQDHALVRMEDVVEEGLVEPDGAQAPRPIADEHLEDPEPRPPRRPDAAAENLAEHRRRHAGTQLRDRLEMAAVLVARREPVKEILDRRQPRAPEIRRPPRPHAFQKLERTLQRVHGSAHCTMTAVP
jgi:hypothetical protein